jgi:hypothetical protein
MAKKQRIYQPAITFNDGVTVRYAIQWDERKLDRLIRDAATNKGGKATAGPLTIYIHPDDLPAAPFPCGVEPPTGMAHNTPCTLEEDHLGDHQNIARNWPNRDAEQWGDDSAQQALERGPR